MSILDYILLGACGIGLAAVTGYAFWIKARVLGFRADVLTILTELERRAVELGLTDDEALRFARRRLVGLIEVADTFSLSTFVYTLSCKNSEKATGAEPWLRSTDPKLQMAIDDARRSAMKRLSHYIVHQTLAGILGTLLMKALPRSIRRKDMKAGAEATMDRLPTTRQHFHAAGC